MADEAGNPFTAQRVKEQMEEGISRRFMSHPLRADQPTRAQRIRAEAGSLARTILKLCPLSAETTRAIDKIDEAAMLAVAAIARNEEASEETAAGDLSGGQ